MGLYLEPPVSDKKAWVKANGIVVGEGVDSIDFNFSRVNEEEVLICNVENGFFDAIAVAFNESEFKVFNRPDGRNKTWAVVKKDTAKKYSIQRVYSGQLNK